MNNFNSSSYTYTPLFCEENIWKLIESFYTDTLATPIDVIFIINASNTIAVFEQKTASTQQPAIWDYHVILSAFTAGQLVIFDFDSRCNFPAEIKSYFSATFPPERKLADKYRPNLRVICAKQYFKYFSSDRKHMKGIIADDQFPAYDIIQPANTAQKLSLKSCININCEISGSSLFTPEKYLLSIDT